MTDISAGTPQSRVIKREFTAARDHMLLDKTTPYLLQHSERSRVGGGFDGVYEPELPTPKNITLTSLTSALKEDELRAVKKTLQKAEQPRKFNHNSGPSQTAPLTY